MDKLTLKRAYELSIIKWEYIVKNNGSNSGIYDIPEIKELYSQTKFNCGYCSYVRLNKIGCLGCPLYTNCNCNHENHLWSIWCFNRTKENAEAVLKLIKDTKPDFRLKKNKV